MPVARSADVVIVGGGVMGAATAWQLAARGRDVVLLERFGAGHTSGASHGASRIYRQTYTDAPYVRLAVEALRLWRDVEAESGAGLLTITGGIDHGDPERLGPLADSLRTHGIAHEWLGPAEAEQRWPGMRFDGPVLYQPDRSGRIHADHAVAALTAAAIGRGAQVHRNTRVTRIQVRGEDLVRVDTEDGAVVRARRAVVTAGAWTAGLLGDLVAGGLVALPPLRVTQEQPAYFPFSGTNPCIPHVADWPTFIHHTDAGGNDDGVYGLADPCGDVKVGFHGVGPECDPDRRTFLPEPAQLHLLQEYVRTWLPGLDHAHPEPISCTYTSTPDSSFVLERTGPLVVGAGFSGHGFKFAPAIGRVLADLATGV
jgi:sarcosine oxidase